MQEIIGYVAAFCTTLAFLPQLIHTLKVKHTEGVSLGMYSLFVIGIVLWLVYGVLIDAMPVIVANVITLVFASIILGVKIKDTLKKK